LAITAKSNRMPCRRKAPAPEWNTAISRMPAHPGPTGACGFDTLRNELKQLAHQTASVSDPEARLFAFSHQMFAHVQPYRPIYRAMARERGGAAVRQHLHRLLVDCSKAELKRLRIGATARELDALTQFFSGAFVGLLSWWLEATTPMSVDDIDKLFRRLAIPALTAAADR
jgi:hypothetical protein